MKIVHANSELNPIKSQMLMLCLLGFAVTQMNFGGIVKKENKFVFFGLKVANERRRYGEGGKQLPVYRY